VELTVALPRPGELVRVVASTTAHQIAAIRACEHNRNMAAVLSHVQDLSGIYLQILFAQLLFHMKT
jgi:hypothetical protein